MILTIILLPLFLVSLLPRHESPSAVCLCGTPRVFFCHPIYPYLQSLSLSSLYYPVLGSPYPCPRCLLTGVFFPDAAPYGGPPSPPPSSIFIPRLSCLLPSVLTRFPATTLLQIYILLLLPTDPVSFCRPHPTGFLFYPIPNLSFPLNVATLISCVGFPPGGAYLWRWFLFNPSGSASISAGDSPVGLPYYAFASLPVPVRITVPSLTLGPRRLLFWCPLSPISQKSF